VRNAKSEARSVKPERKLTLDDRSDTSHRFRKASLENDSFLLSSKDAIDIGNFRAKDHDASKSATHVRKRTVIPRRQERLGYQSERSPTQKKKSEELSTARP